MIQPSEAYRGVRQRMTEIVLGLPPDSLGARVPACPAWSVQDLYAHVVGVAEDTATGTLEGLGSDQWTAAQVGRLSTLGVEALARRWEEIASGLEPAVAQIPFGASSMLIGDAVSHEHDLRGAVGRPGARDSEAVWIGLERFVRWFGKRVKDAGLPSVVVRAAEREWQAGVLDPGAEVKAEPFALLRALTGRRTREEIAALDWSGDAAPYVPLFSTYTTPEESLGEG